MARTGKAAPHFRPNEDRDAGTRRAAVPMLAGHSYSWTGAEIYSRTTVSIASYAAVMNALHALDQRAVPLMMATRDADDLGHTCPVSDLFATPAASCWIAWRFPTHGGATSTSAWN